MWLVSECYEEAIGVTFSSTNTVGDVLELTHNLGTVDSDGALFYLHIFEHVWYNVIMSYSPCNVSDFSAKHAETVGVSDHTVKMKLATVLIEGTRNSRKGREKKVISGIFTALRNVCSCCILEQVLTGQREVVDLQFEQASHCTKSTSILWGPQLIKHGYGIAYRIVSMLKTYSIITADFFKKSSIATLTYCNKILPIDATKAYLSSLCYKHEHDNSNTFSIFLPYYWNSYTIGNKHYYKYSYSK